MAKNKDRLVSFVISAFNEEKYIEACIESCLNQTYGNVEVVVVNDGSTDSTADVIRRAFGGDRSVRLIDLQENRGKVQGFNTAVEDARGDFIAIMGADDICYPRRIAASLAKMNERTGLVCSDLNKINAAGEIIARHIVRMEFGILSPRDLSTKALIEKPKVFGGTILLTRRTAEKIFPLDAGLAHEDWYIPVVASLQSEVAFVDEPLIGYRIHDRNTSGSIAQLDYSRWLFLKQRRRAYFQALLKLVDEHGIDADRDKLRYLLAQAEIFSQESRLRYCLASFRHIKGLKNRAKLAVHLFPYVLYQFEKAGRRFKASPLGRSRFAPG